MPDRASDGGDRPRRRAGRPPKPQDGSSSFLARFGVELRGLRTRRELTLHQLADMTGYSGQHIGAVERGRVVPSEAMVAACDAALLANGRLTGMLAAVIREQAVIRDQSQSARRAKNTAGRNQTSALSAADRETNLDLDWDRLGAVGRRTSPVTPAVVDDLEQITDRQRHLYHELSSAEMLVHVQAQLGLLTALLEGHQLSSLRRRIASAAGEAAGFAAWLWFDLGENFNADRAYVYARAAVGEAEDSGLGAYVKGYQALVAAHTDGPRASLVHLGEARETAPRSLSGTTRSWLTILEAEALADTGQSAAARRAIAEAYDCLSDPRPEGADPWMYDFDQSSLAAHTGSCHLALEQPKLAAEAFTNALRLLPPSCDRRGAKIQIGLARAQLACGNADEALRLTTSALDTFAHRGSVAGLRRVRQVRDAFARAGVGSAVDALEEQVRSLQRPTG
ncbi:helix-turn-helix domain-containing protein [Pseudonocardia sp. Cha107L01]|uniref:helix-turn-helix domain-containing protein n=1 Tax=Pseudonocardia sp. Cha107L01 TaxID=3457576 RepID=UPI00403EBDD8